MSKKAALQLMDRGLLMIEQALRMMREESEPYDEPPVPVRRTVYKDGVFPKICSCGMQYGMVAWAGLKFVGIQEGADSGERYYSDLEMRECAGCETQLSVAIEEV